MLRRISREPGALAAVIAAIAVHVSWRRMLERADALTLVPLDMQAQTHVLLQVVGGIALVLLLVTLYLQRPRRGAGPLQAAEV